MKADEFVEEADEYAKQCHPGSVMDRTLVRTRIPLLISIIESHRAALDKIESMATIETVEIQRIAREELKREV